MEALKLANKTSEQLRALISQKKPLFIPFGTLEAHGRHLPVTSDTICANGLALRLAERFNGLAAPALEYGITGQLFEYPVASRFKTETYYNFVVELLESFILHKFTRIFLINGHGGNNLVLNQITKELSGRHGVGLCVVHWWDAVEELTKHYFGGSGGHAVAEETAAILAFAPELVDQAAFTPETMFRCRKGIYVCPPPGAALTYDDDAVVPLFDQKNAVGFMEKVVDCLVEFLTPVLEGWERMKL